MLEFADMTVPDKTDDRSGQNRWPFRSKPMTVPVKTGGPTFYYIWDVKTPPDVARYRVKPVYKCTNLEPAWLAGFPVLDVDITVRLKLTLEVPEAKAVR